MNPNVLASVTAVAPQQAVPATTGRPAAEAGAPAPAPHVPGRRTAPDESTAAPVPAGGPPGGTTRPAPPPGAEPTDCELCDCQQHEWNGLNYVLRTDPPQTCKCGHPTYRHRYREPAT